MRTLLLLLFSVAWAAVAFAVIRAIMIAWGYHRRLAMATAFAVAAAFVLGAINPFSLAQRVNGPPPVAAVVVAPRHPIFCPAQVKVVKAPGQGHIDSLSIDGVAVDVTKPAEASRAASLKVGGWVVATGGLANAMCVLVDGQPVAHTGDYGLDRPDVSTALGKPDERAAGFEIVVHLAPGEHVLDVGPVQGDGTVTPLNQAVKVRVR